MATMTAPAWTRRLAVPRDRLAFAIGVSVLLHLVVLMMRFAPPAPIRFEPIDPRLEVILLNAQTENRPARPEVLAQVDMVGGGDRDTGRARSPLPAEKQASDGEALVRQRQRVAELEARQRELLALAAGKPVPVQAERPAPKAAPQPTGQDDQSADAVIARLQAQIDKQISDYNKRPKRLTYGINAVGVSYARYVEDWAARIEKIGTERYPPEARGKLYDSLIITVEIDRDGNVVDVIVDKPSKHAALNRAVRQIVLAGAPYPRFSDAMAREGDILQIVRTWNFTRGGLETEAVDRP
ncbi:energy transducer TonB [Zeimonas arvi]|uniref:TonB family protein n=1 Tax=Zeimonas arvi TaxID=2498847 RepID=A0A5C8P5H5_9BURK|nr:TonB family protein [Zeimonas arvi]TXL68780.1 TonB family protein [Zeimonas arvi]